MKMSSRVPKGPCFEFIKFMAHGKKLWVMQRMGKMLDRGGAETPRKTSYPDGHQDC
jgi:hypothetical protein